MSILQSAKNRKDMDMKEEAKENSRLSREELEEKLRTERPAAWDQIPDIDLYKDQLTEYLKRQHIGFVLGMEEPLTSAMINNYIKVGVLPRANGKRYNRDHIAYLTAVSLLKQVLSVQETGDILKLAGDKGDVKDFYEEYADMLDEALESAADELGKAEENDLRGLAMKLAVQSYADKLLARELINLMGERQKQGGVVLQDQD